MTGCFCYPTLQQSCNVCASACSKGQRHFQRHRSSGDVLRCIILALRIFPASHVPAWAEGERGLGERGATEDFSGVQLISFPLAFNYFLSSPARFSASC